MTQAKEKRSRRGSRGATVPLIGLGEHTAKLATKLSERVVADNKLVTIYFFLKIILEITFIHLFLLLLSAGAAEGLGNGDGRRGRGE
jgi:hypothetical protein